jgi:hypothetical protein
LTRGVLVPFTAFFVPIAALALRTITLALRRLTDLEQAIADFRTEGQLAITRRLHTLEEQLNRRLPAVDLFT